MDRMKKAAACLLAAFLCLVSVSGCKPSSNPGSSDKSEEPGPAPAESGTGEPGEITVGDPTFYPVIYNSDTTHIYQNVSPYHKALHDPLTPEMFDAAVKEAADAGANCFEITPGHCWVPWWPSEAFPVAEHARWFINDFKGTMVSNPFYDYVFKAPNSLPYHNYRDFIQEQIESCRKYGMGAFINFRLNDAHMIMKTTPDLANIAFASPLYIEHPEYAIGEIQGYKDKYVYVLDWRHKEVRDNRLTMIKELIANYEIDGFELDFMRRFCFFNTDKCTKEERVSIMTEFLREVRGALDEASAKDGRYRYLSVRIPAYTDTYGDMGIDIKAWQEAGVGIFNLASSYFVDQDTDIRTVKETVGNDALVYMELTHTTACGYENGEKGNQTRIHRRTTPEQFYTSALLGYAQGADGISLFNFQYYRGDRMGTGDAPLTEPPFDVIQHLGDKNYLKQAPQHYFYGETWCDPVKSGWQLPRTMMTGLSTEFDMELVRPDGGWTQDGVYRLKANEAFTNQQYTVTINGTKLQEIADAGEPYPNDYTQLLGTAAQRKSYRVPRSILKEGTNTITVEQTAGSRIVLGFVDLAVR